MQASTDPGRYHPLVKSIALKIREALAENIDLEQLVNLGEARLPQTLAQYRPRQGLTLRTYLEYKIRMAIYDGLTNHPWRNKKSRSHYLFAKKSNEVLFQFHLSAEGTTKRSIKAEEEELLYILSLLTVIALLVFDAKRVVNLLDNRQKDFVKTYYELDLTIAKAAEKIGIPASAASRYHLQILEKLSRVNA